jgi:hypothetical protein
MSDVKVRILPLKGIGGVGNAGDVVWMTAADAEMYVRDGFVEVVEDSAPSALRASPPNSESANLEENHEIMKPAKKRRK